MKTENIKHFGTPGGCILCTTAEINQSVSRTRSIKQVTCVRCINAMIKKLRSKLLTAARTRRYENLVRKDR
jgi:hypothetical protein